MAYEHKPVTLTIIHYLVGGVEFDAMNVDVDEDGVRDDEVAEGGYEKLLLSEIEKHYQY